MKSEKLHETETMKSLIKTMILNTGDAMAGCGYFEGFLKTMWAEMVLETIDEKEAAKLYWDMRKRIGWEAN